ncbi:hypothetical protein BJQ94_10390 [Cryobacterium sp. SO2]|uniref:hypothetical protein n=1 Tax=Cryobacterium sp. SO2 TaxID=1897060 RepID=UPI00223DECDB|nr:hypothetical protein [Cryobacterium sp. SO2]WEO75794.1 hypothetical protein BJQ94_10390 [Cryobacterium sp. SO2]
MRRGGWFQRNRLALLAIVVLLPATLGIMAVHQWLGYFAGWPSKPVDVTAGESVRYGQFGWRIESTDRVGADSAEGRERDLPAGTDLVVVTVRVDPTGATRPTVAADASALVDTWRLCTARLEERGGPHAARSWTNAANGAVSLAGAGPALSSCSSELSEPYTFDAEFVVPHDAGEQATLALGISVVSELPEYARFALD